jgi:hypothetical protein
MVKEEDNNRAGVVGMTGVTRTRKEEAGYDSHTTGTLEASSGRVHYL